MKVEAVPLPQIVITLEYDEAVELKKSLRGMREVAITSRLSCYVVARNLEDWLEKLT